MDNFDLSASDDNQPPGQDRQHFYFDCSPEFITLFKKYPVIKIENHKKLPVIFSFCLIDLRVHFYLRAF